MATSKLRTTVQRGYGEPHRRRVKAERPLQIGRPCARCGWPMLAGQKIQLDHTDDRSGYLGWSHRACNVAASNRRRARLARAQRAAQPRQPTATRRSTKPQPEVEEVGVWVLSQRPRQHTRGW
jgi:hypothetical protein